jgi:hypothetical protein
MTETEVPAAAFADACAVSTAHTPFITAPAGPGVAGYDPDFITDDCLYAPKSTAFKSMDDSNAKLAAFNVLPARALKYVGRNVVLSTCRRLLTKTGTATAAARVTDTAATGVAAATHGDAGSVVNDGQLWDISVVEIGHLSLQQVCCDPALALRCLPSSPSLTCWSLMLFACCFVDVQDDLMTELRVDAKRVSDGVRYTLHLDVEQLKVRVRVCARTFVGGDAGWIGLCSPVSAIV